MRHVLTLRRQRRPFSHFSYRSFFSQPNPAAAAANAALLFLQHRAGGGDGTRTAAAAAAAAAAACPPAACRGCRLFATGGPSPSPASSSSASSAFSSASAGSTSSKNAFPALLAACGLASGLVLTAEDRVAEAAGTTTASGGKPSSSSSPSSSAHLQFLGPDFIADAVAKAAPALVNLTVDVQGGWGQSGQSTGSGFIISEDGFVVTNNHVVASGWGGGERVTVTLSNGRRLRARVHSTDRLSDLALVKIEGRPGEKFPVMRVGTSSVLKPGQWVIALGSPLTLQNTVTAGIISSVARHSSEIGMAQQRQEYIQTDAAINQGNSGGPLINIAGEVIGINTMKTAQGAGIGFAIPIDTAWQVIKQLRANRKVVRPYLGIKMVTLDPVVVKEERLNNPDFPQLDYGVMVVHVAPGSPAEAGGLRSGDIVLEFDGRAVRSTRDILDRLGVEVGKRVRLKVLRDGKEVGLELVSVAAPGRR